jgi:hypothetical protein
MTRPGAGEYDAIAWVFAGNFTSLFVFFAIVLLSSL